MLATGGGTACGHINTYNVSSGARVHSVNTGSQVSSLAYSQAHKELLSTHGFSDNSVSLWSASSMARVARLEGHTDRICASAISPDGTTCVSAGADETLRFWKCWAADPASKKKVRASAPSSRLTATLR